MWIKTKGYQEFIILLVLILVLGTFSSASEVKTPAEAVNYSQYSQYEEISLFLSQLDTLSDELAVKIVGRTLGTQRYSAKDLYLCILSEERIGSPEKLNRSKPTLYLVAAKHGREQSGKEAALWFVRDLAIGELKPLLRQVNVLVLPTANPYGNWFNQRRNEQNLDLNRDHVKMESPEVEVINRIFRTWMPEVTLDVHEKGYDYYQVNVGCVSNVNIHPRFQEFSRQVILPELEKSLVKAGFTFHEYLLNQEMGIDSSAGVEYPDEYLAGREIMYRYSTSDLNDGRNSLGIYETLAFIQEGSSRHDIETLKERTHYQYHGIRYLAESVVRHGHDINSLVRNLRKELLERAREYSQGDVVHVRMKYGRDENEPTLAFKKLERSRSPVRGILKEDKLAGDPITARDLESYPHRAEYKLVDRVEKNWFPLVKPTVSVPRPLGYIIPGQRQDVVETLYRHGFQLDCFTRDISLDVEAYHILEVTPADYDYLPPQTIKVKKEFHTVIAKRGDFYISCVQAGTNLIPCLLEPQSHYGFIRYWKYKLVPQQGDIFPIYRAVNDPEKPLVPYKNR
jgi:hypothetical protein